MKLTKYEHACVFLESNGAKLVIDPGEYTSLPEDLTGVKAVVVTHHHADHLDNKNLKKMLATSPELVLYAHKEVLADLTVAAKTKEVSGSLSFEFCGVKVNLEEDAHEVIYEASPCRNLSVLVEGEYYYPGDSYKPSSSKVRVVGVPMSGPWAKVSSSIDFAKACNGEVYIPVHNAHLNEHGITGYNNWLRKELEAVDKSWLDLVDRASV